MPSLLLRRVAPVLALLAVVATACGSVTESPAVSVNGDEIGRETLQDELEIIRDNRAYRAALEQAYGVQLGGESEGTFSAAFTAQVLSLQVYYEMVEQALAEDGVRVTKKDVDEARDIVAEQVGSLGPNVLKKFPKAYRDRLAHQEAVIAVAAEHAAKDVEVACVSHILITTESRTEAEAKTKIDAIKTQLDDGAEFAEVARANSEDPGSKDNGGDLDCGPRGRFVPEFDEAAFSQPIGEVGDPVKTDFGYHLILVTSREKGGEASPEAGQQALGVFISEVVCDEDADIDVNPRYGRWDRSGCDEGELAKVSPPRSPKKSS